MRSLVAIGSTPLAGPLLSRKAAASCHALHSPTEKLLKGGDFSRTIRAGEDRRRGIGGWGARRKPMSVVRALLRTDVTDLTVVSWGGPDVGLLCAVGKVKRLVYAGSSSAYGDTEVLPKVEKYRGRVLKTSLSEEREKRLR